MSNTKILPSDKSALKNFKARMPRNMAFATSDSGRVTVLVVRQTNCVHLVSAVASPDEQKRRRKVGEWYAMDYFQNNKYIAVPIQDWQEHETAAQIAEYWASILD